MILNEIITEIEKLDNEQLSKIMRNMNMCLIIFPKW